MRSFTHSNYYEEATEVVVGAMDVVVAMSGTVVVVAGTVVEGATARP